MWCIPHQLQVCVTGGGYALARFLTPPFDSSGGLPGRKGSALGLAFLLWGFSTLSQQGNGVRETPQSL